MTQTNMHRSRPRALGRLAATLALALGLGAGWMVADAAEGEYSFGGGGDTVGSLPMMAPPPPSLGFAGSAQNPYGNQVAEYGPARPVFALSGRHAAVLACVQDAFSPAGGEPGSYRFVALGGDRVRLEFHGRVTVLVDRARFEASAVRSEIVVGSSFHGGIAELEVGGVPRGTQVLRYGLIDMRLRALDGVGVLDQGLNWHAISLAADHRVIDVRAAGGLLRIDQRD